MIRETVLQKIIWWELNRLVFNVCMLAFGVLIIYLVNQVKYVSLFSHTHPHAFSSFYTQIIFFYAVLVNFFYAVIYGYSIAISKKLQLDFSKQTSVELFSKKLLFAAGFTLTVIMGCIEAIYRLYYM